MLELLFSSPFAFAVWALCLIVAVTIHEFAHAYVADRLGDPTPRAMGRVTLNPLSHMDPVGTIALLIANIGWGKPVPFDPYNLENPKRDSVLIALAGPASNLILATILSISARFLPNISFIAIPMIILNIGLAVFNLVPIPPLDGSKILAGLLPYRQAYAFERMTNQYGMWLLIFLLLPFGGQSLISMFISPIISFLTRLLIPGSVGI